MRPTKQQQQRHRATQPMLLHYSRSMLVLASLLLLLQLQTIQVSGFASWFVDRKVSCFTDLLENEIIMNNRVASFEESRTLGIRVEVSPLLFNDNNNNHQNNNNNDDGTGQYQVKFVVPSNAAANLKDMQYILELSGGPDTTTASTDQGSSLLDPPAKFTQSPEKGGIGCDGRRSHGKVASDNASSSSSSSAVVTMNQDAVKGATLEIWGGWATGHEAVRLTEKVTIIVGRGIVQNDALLLGDKGEEDYHYDDDVWDGDDELTYEHEAEIIENQRKTLDQVIDTAEEDAVQALEEKRIETDGRASQQINEAEQEIVEVLEENRKDVNEALNELKAEIILDNEDNKHQHTNADNIDNEQLMKKKMIAEEAMKKHREHQLHMTKKHDELKEMQRHMMMKERKDKEHAVQEKNYNNNNIHNNHNHNNNNNNNNNHEQAKNEKLNNLINMKDTIQSSLKKLTKVDQTEHNKAHSQHQKPLPKQEITVDIQELKRKAKEKLAHVQQTVTVGVNELFTQEQRQDILRKTDKLRNRIEGDRGTIRGRGETLEGGKPLSPSGQHFLMIFFGMFGLVGLVRWFMESRRRTHGYKGRRTL